jgi:predicted RND superfamily exporter protein
MDYKDILPADLDAIKASNLFADNFGTTDSVNFVIELDPEIAKSNEPRDVRDYEVLEYMDRLQQYISSSKQVSSTNSAVTILKTMNDGHIPKDKAQIKAAMEKNGLLKNYISEDGTTALISINLEENYNDAELLDDMNDALRAVDAPLGVNAQVSGSIIADTIVHNMLSDDMATTSELSMFGIIFILILSFWSIRYGLMPLTTIIIGVIWAMGFIGFIGLGMNSATSGVISMIMGIGIDFGIQIVNRFRQEYTKTKDVEGSMRTTLENVMFPLFITTLAALIGFKAMSMGQLTIFADMGNMMAFGVAFCFLVSVTVVPVITMYAEKVYYRIHRFRLLNKKISNKKQKV